MSFGHWRGDREEQLTPISPIRITLPARFIGNDSLGYKNGRMYELQIIVTRQNGPVIYLPFACPYGSWFVFWQNWRPIR